MRYHNTLTETSHRIQSARKDRELEFSYTASEYVKWYSHYGKQFGSFLLSE